MTLRKREKAGQHPPLDPDSVVFGMNLIRDRITNTLNETRETLRPDFLLGYETALHDIRSDIDSVAAQLLEPENGDTCD